jgi:hypothetical protein
VGAAPAVAVADARGVLGKGQGQGEGQGEGEGSGEGNGDGDGSGGSGSGSGGGGGASDMPNLGSSGVHTLDSTDDAAGEAWVPRACLSARARTRLHEALMKHLGGEMGSRPSGGAGRRRR